MDKIIFESFEIISNAIKAGKIPAACLGIINKAGQRAVIFDGYAQLIPYQRALTRESQFDLASVTKVMFTTIAILQEVAKNNIALDDKISKYIPDLRQYDLKAKERELTIRQCLNHQTFFPAVEPIYTYGLDPLTMRAYITQKEWAHFEPRYSDINYLLLGILLERVRGSYLKDQKTPRGTSFTPFKEHAVATEFCAWRARVICGEVHDENAFAFGGASGHAGLFGNIDSVLDFGFDILNEKLLPHDLNEQLFIKSTPTRSLGFEIKYENWSGGDKCSPLTIGHTGFTGTGIWIDKERQIAWSLLTNRVHPSRHKDSGIIQLRKDIGNLIIENFDKS